MAYLLAFPVFIILAMAQIGIVSQVHLLRGTGDLVMIALVAWTLNERGSSAWAWAMVAGLLISFVSATPMFAPLAGYFNPDRHCTPSAQADLASALTGNVSGDYAGHDYYSVHLSYRSQGDWDAFTLAGKP